VSRAELERRLDEIAARIEAVIPFGLDLSWAEWADDAELRWLKELFWRLADEGGEPSDAEQLRALAIYANATAR
jgi:hypothetical protein